MRHGSGLGPQQKPVVEWGMIVELAFRSVCALPAVLLSVEMGPDFD